MPIPKKVFYGQATFDDALKIYGTPAAKKYVERGELYVAKLGTKIIGFMKFNGGVGEKLRVPQGYRSGEYAKFRVAENLFKHAMKDYFVSNPKRKQIRFLAIEESRSERRQIALERWYKMLGAKQAVHKKNSFSIHKNTVRHWNAK